MRFLVSCGLIAGLLLTQPVRADTIIDTFDDSDPGLWPAIANSGTPFVSSSDSGVAGVIGGVRDGFVNWQAGPLNVTAAVLTGPGIYSLSSDVLTNGSSALSYNAGGLGLSLDLLDPHGTGSSALDPGAAFIIEVVSSDLGGVPIFVQLTDGSGGTGVQGAVAAGGGAVSIPLQDFLPIDFSDIDQIDVSFDPPDEFDITVDYLAFDWPDPRPIIPEPTSLAVWSLLGLTLSSARWRRRTR